jgi:hypothetical protein
VFESELAWQVDKYAQAKGNKSWGRSVIVKTVIYNLLANCAAEQRGDKYKFKHKTISEYKHFIKSTTAPKKLLALQKPFAIQKPQAALTKNFNNEENAMASLLFIALRGGRGNESGYVRKEFTMLWDFASRVCANIYAKDEAKLVTKWNYLKSKETEETRARLVDLAVSVDIAIEAADEKGEEVALKV